MAYLSSKTSAKKQVRVLVAGHSFVSRLERAMGLSTSEFTTQLIGRSGGTINTLRKDLGANITKHRDLKPQLAYLEIGSNDLCSTGATPDRVAENIFDICRYLHFGHGSHMIIVGEILIRHKRHHKYFPDQLTLTEYNVKVEETNKCLKALAELNASFMTFWHHKGFIAQSAFDRFDGVHPGRPKGQAKYACSVKHAIVAARNTHSHI